MNATLPHLTAQPSLSPVVRTATVPLEINHLRAVLDEQHDLGDSRPAGHILWQGGWERDPDKGH